MKRIAAVDTLRGISLLGILMVNAPFFFMPEGSAGTYSATRFPSLLDRAATFSMHALFEGKFVLLFAFLFGFGFHAQMDGEADSRARYFRRLLGLLFIGILHATLLFVGDILVSYAILGVVLFWFRAWPIRRLLVASAWLWGVSIACHVGLGLLGQDIPPTEAAHLEALVQLHQAGSFTDIVRHRLVELAQLYAITPFFFMPSILGMFLFGLAVAKQCAATSIDSVKPLARKILRGAALPALGLNALYGFVSLCPSIHLALALGLRAVAVVGLGLVLLSAAVLALTTPRFESIGRWLGADGQMSLSLYISESMVMGTLAQSHGLRLYGTVGPAAQCAIAGLVYTALLVAASAWMRIFRMGPLEWCLRSFVHLRLLPMWRAPAHLSEAL
jgi:uncharacterized protein